jgi:hypothetical protein
MPARERVALDRATMKLEVLGPGLPFPHQSDIRQRQRPARTATAWGTERMASPLPPRRWCLRDRGCGTRKHRPARVSSSAWRS